MRKWILIPYAALIALTPSACGDEAALVIDGQSGSAAGEAGTEGGDGSLLHVGRNSVRALIAADAGEIRISGEGLDLGVGSDGVGTAARTGDSASPAVATNSPQAGPLTAAAAAER